MFFDIAMIASGFAAGLFARFGHVPYEEWTGVLATILILYLFSAASLGGYSLASLRSSKLGTWRTLASNLMAFLLLSLVLYLLKAGDDYSRLAMGISLGLSSLFLVIGRITTGKIAMHVSGGQFSNEVVLVEDLRALHHFPGLQADLPLVFDLGALHVKPVHDDLASQIKFAELVQEADRIVVACRRENEGAWTEFLRCSDARGEILPTDAGIEQPLAIGNFHGKNTLVVTKGKLSFRQKFLKRAFDLVVASGLLLLSAPLLVCIALIVKLDSRGPVFFRQERLGKGNVPFLIFKFRTMRTGESDRHGLVSTARQDSRITRFGKVLRKTSLDELPQLLNVIGGEMSIVGPRPHALGSTAEDKLFWQVDREYWKRHLTKPGITGLAQVRGHRGATESVDHLKARLQSDLEYIANWSLVRDIEIIFRTLSVVMHPNAY